MDKFKVLVEWLKGKKTYFVIGAGLLLLNLELVGVIPDGTYENARPTLELLGAGTITAKLNRMITG